MAITNSIVMGKAHGKIGNIVLSHSQAQSIARSCPIKGTREYSPAQISRQQKTSAIYKAWGNVQYNCKGWKYWVPYKLSKFNFFWQKFGNTIPADLSQSNNKLLSSLVGTSFGYSPICEPSGATKNNLTVKINLNLVYNMRPARMYIMCAIYHNASGSMKWIDRLITVEEFNQKFINCIFDVDWADFCQVYLYTKNYKYCSGIHWFRLSNFV